MHIFVREIPQIQFYLKIFPLKLFKLPFMKKNFTTPPFLLLFLTLFFSSGVLLAQNRALRIGNVADTQPPVIACPQDFIINNTPNACTGTFASSNLLVQYLPQGNFISNLTPIAPSNVASGVTASPLSQTGVTNQFFGLDDVWPVGDDYTGDLNPNRYLTFSATFSSATLLTELTYYKYSYYGNGPRKASIRTSLDGFATDISTIDVNPSGFADLRFNLLSLPLLNGTVSFRIYFYDSASNGDFSALVGPYYGPRGLRLLGSSLFNISDESSITNITTTGLSPNNQYPIGSTRITSIVTDASNNTATCSFNVTVIDNQPPVITCPANINATATSANGAVVTYTAPVGIDNCTGATTARIAGPASGATFPIGTTTVTHQVTDAANNVTQCSFTVTVSGVAPQISCPANISISNQTGQCGAVVTFAATETAGIPASTITYSVPPGSFFPVGTTSVKATATNDAGNSECTFTVTVNDTQKPMLTCPANINAMATSFDGAAVTYTALVGTDNCPGATTTRIAGPASGSTFPVGTTTVTYEVTDAANNKTQCSFTVTVALPTCGLKNQNLQICYYGVTQCVSEKIAKNYIKLGATLGPCNAGNTRISYEETTPAQLTLSLKAYPNPVQDAVTVEVMAPSAGMATLQVLDVTGLTRQSRLLQFSEGSNEVQLRLGSLPTGIYLIRAVDALGQQGVVRVNKQ